jgi:hypothetical protein
VGCRGLVNVAGAAEEDVLQLPAAAVAKFRVDRAQVARELAAAEDDEAAG